MTEPAPVEEARLPEPTGRVRLVASDMDGTLLRADLTISDRTVDAVAAVHDAGVRVVVATGRGWRSAVPLLEPLPQVAVAVCSNGALVRDVHGEANTDVFAFAAGRAEVLVEAVVATVPDAGLAWELADGGFGYDRVYAGLRPDLADAFPERVGDRPATDADMLKLLVRHPDLDEAELLAVLEPNVPGDVLATYSGIDTVEITGAGVHKAHALSVLCRRWGIHPADVVTLGDNRNDVEMLTWAGRGVAMGNAVPAAVAAADERAAHHEDDGVALVLESVLDQLRG